MALMTGSEGELVFPKLTPHPGLRLLVQAYSLGAFPMAESRDAEGVEFFTANPRCIFPLDGSLRWPRSLRAKVKRREFRITSDKAFEFVVRGCAEATRRHDPAAGELPGTWINDWIIETYTELHACGLAHSVEAWLPVKWALSNPQLPRLVPGQDIAAGSFAMPGPQPVHIQDGMMLVGGLYGVQLGGAFCGESMFSRPDFGGSDASKVCLAELVAHLMRRGFVVLDSQISNAHVSSLGGVTVPLGQYLAMLARALLRRTPWAWEDTEGSAGTGHRGSV